jgi:hypothetical protein
MTATPRLPTVTSIEELAGLIDGRQDVYLRWSREPAHDIASASRDELTGVELPGLSVSALAVEPWWAGRDLGLWVARRLYDYEHLQRRRRGARPWLLSGRECGRGPDNEPLVDQPQPVAWVSQSVVDEARRLIDAVAEDWGSLDRAASG